MRKTCRISVLLLICSLLVTGAAFAMDPGGMGAPPDGMDMGGPPPDGMDMGSGPPGGGGDSAGSTAVAYITDGATDTAKQYGTDSPVRIETAASAVGVTAAEAVGVKLTSGDYSANGIIVSGAATTYRIGGKSEFYEVDGKQYNSVFLFGADTAVESGASGGTAVAAQGGAKLFIDNTYLRVDGAGRYVTAAYGTSELIVNDSVVYSTGSNENTTAISEPFSNAALLIYGTARSNFSIGASATYYYNSECLAEGWAALSTDSSTGNGLDLYVYQTYAEAINGGYGTYADFGCRVWLYGSEVKGGELGAILSKSGSINLYDNTAATKDNALRYADEVGATVGTQTVSSALVGGRNAIMLHAPDMMGQGAAATDTGYLTVVNGTLKTDKDLKSVRDYGAFYSPAVGAYIDYISGSAILIKSTSCYIDLQNANIETYNDVLIQTVLNSDSMGNFLAESDSAGSKIDGVIVKMADMDIKGDILHEDYQRKMNIELTNTKLEGAIIGSSFDDWYDTWKEYKDDSYCYWLPDTAWSAVYGVNLTLGSGSEWTATENSNLTTLTIKEGASIVGNMYVKGELTNAAPGTYEDVIVTNTAAPAPEYTPVETSTAAAPAVEPATPPTGDSPPVAQPAPAQDEPGPVGPATGAQSYLYVILALCVIGLAVTAPKLIKKSRAN